MKMVNGKEVQETDADVAQQQVDAAARLASVSMQALRALDMGSGMLRWQRDVVIAALAADHPQRVKAAAIEQQAATYRAALKS